MTKRTSLQNVDISFVELFKKKRKQTNIQTFSEFTRRITDEIEGRSIFERPLPQNKKEGKREFRPIF